MQTKLPLAFLLACLFASAFAQDKAQPMLVVYVQGSGDASVNKLLGIKLLSALSQGGVYADVADPGAFQDDIAKASKGGTAQMSQIAQAARQHGADYVCAVAMAEAFGAYSISARILKVSDLQVVKAGSADRSLKSLDDLTEVSKELARQLLPQENPVLPPPPAKAAAAPPSANGSAAPLAFIASGSFGEAAGQDSMPAPAIAGGAAAGAIAAASPAASQKQCARKHNINELLFKIKDGFPRQLKDCASKLAKDMALAASPFGKKGAAPQPVPFMRQCAVDGIKSEIPDGFPDADKFIGSIDNFLQTIMSAASAGGSLDARKLISAVGSMDINGLLNDMKKLAFSNKCIVNEPYEPPAASANSAEGDGEGGDKEKGESAVSFGIRGGFNFSHTYMEYYDRYGGRRIGSYGSVFGGQLGFVLDIAGSSWFHIQPGIMYIKKGMDDGNRNIAIHYLEIPFLFSLKFSALRLNAGPYLGLCLSGDYACGGDFGLSMGFGFDMGPFYIGMLYDYGLTNVSSMDGREFYNRALVFNLGINL